jgi:hypothetical protein
MTWDEEERKVFEFSEEKKNTSLEWEASTSDIFFLAQTPGALAIHENDPIYREIR